MTEHPFYASWGYQTLGYYAPTRRYGTPARLHGLRGPRCTAAASASSSTGCPPTSPRTPTGSPIFDGTHLYEHADPRLREHPDWGTRVFNYGRREVANFLIANALFWLERYHIDGLRVDAVASMIYRDYSRKAGEWIPNEYGGRENLEAIAFLRRLNEVVYGGHPGAVTIAEESTAWPQVSRPVHLGGLGFGFKWNMGWMHDILELHAATSRCTGSTTTTSSPSACSTRGRRTSSCRSPTTRWSTARARSPARCPATTGSASPTCACSTRFMWAYPGKKLLFMGGEFGQSDEWNHDRSLDWQLLDMGPYHRGAPAARGGPEPALPERAVPPRSRLRAGGLPVDGLQRLASRASSTFCRFARDRERLAPLRVQLHARWRGEATGSASPAPASIARPLNTRRVRLRRRRRGQRRRRARASPSPGTGSRTRCC